MIVVIIAGGSGSRLWPLSTPEYPKHLLSVNNDSRSLLQNTFHRARRLTKTIYIVSEAGHIQHVKEQLPELPDTAFIVEPARRGTAGCIVAALAEISKHHDRNEPVAFLAADHYIRDIQGFVHTFKIAAKTSQQEGRIVLVGVEPDYAATGFGYIQKGTVLNDSSFVFNVHSFKEKPAHAVAREYVKSGNYLWNCSYFLGSIDTFKAVMEQDAPELLENLTRLEEAASPKAYEEAYLSFETISIDYALIEKVTNLLVVPASFDWMDLGTYADLYKAADHDLAGNHLGGNQIEVEEVENAFIENHEDKPMAVVGLNNVAIINTPQGILIIRKDLSQKVGDISKRFKT